MSAQSAIRTIRCTGAQSVRVQAFSSFSGTSRPGAQSFQLAYTIVALRVSGMQACLMGPPCAVSALDARTG